MAPKLQKEGLLVSSLSPSLAPLYEWLMRSPVGTVREASNSGELSAIIPEWERVRGPWHIQHHAHHFPLDDHTLKVVEATQRSPFFATLTPYEQWLTALSALLHDIEKNTGPERIHGLVPVDKLHPLKSAMTALKLLSGLGMPMDDVLRCVTLIHHHQAFGQLFIRYGEEGHAPDGELLRIARKLRSVRLTHCLLALSEGDIRSVQQENAYFTPGIEVKLHQYGRQVCDMIATRWPNQPLIASFEPIAKPAIADKPPHRDLPTGLCLWPITDWSQLMTLLTDEPWGGAWAFPLATSWESVWQQPNVLAVMGVRCLPENIAYLGPELPSLGLDWDQNTPLRVPMATFYEAWEEQHIITRASHPAEAAQQQDIEQFNQDPLSSRIAGNDPSGLSSEPMATVLLGTRPIIQSLWLNASAPEALVNVWHQSLPVIGHVSPPTAYAYGRL